MTFTVYGLPGAQGSKRHVGGGRMIEMSKKVGPWREAVVQAVMLAAPFGTRKEPILFRGAVAVDIVFTMHRPKSARSGSRPAVAPDIDKLCRSTFDALKTAGVYEDDARVVRLRCSKVYPDHVEIGNCAGDGLPVPGARIRIERIA